MATIFQALGGAAAAAAAASLTNSFDSKKLLLPSSRRSLAGLFSCLQKLMLPFPFSKQDLL